MCRYLCNSSYLLKLYINRVIIQNTVKPRHCNHTSEINAMAPVGHTPTSTTVSAWRRNCAANCSLSPKWEPNASSPTMKYLERDENDLIFIFTHNGKIGYRWLLSESCNISGGWDGRSVRIILSSLHVNCNDCSMTNTAGDELWLTSVEFLSWPFGSLPMKLHLWLTLIHWITPWERERRIIIHPLLFFVLLFEGATTESKYTNPFLSFFQFSSETWIYFSFFAILNIIDQDQLKDFLQMILKIIIVFILCCVST